MLPSQLVSSSAAGVPTIAGDIAAAFSSVYSAVTGSGTSVIQNTTSSGTTVTATGTTPAPAAAIGGLSLGTIVLVAAVAWFVFK